MTYDDIAPFLWFGFSAGFLVGWLAYIGLDALERCLIARITRRPSQPSGSRP